MLDAITLVTVTEVRPGTELTADYATWEVDESYIMKKPCSCGAFACRNRITGRDWTSEECRAFLAQWAAPFIRRRIADMV